MVLLPGAFFLSWVLRILRKITYPVFLLARYAEIIRAVRHTRHRLFSVQLTVSGPLLEVVAGGGEGFWVGATGNRLEKFEAEPQCLAFLNQSLCRVTTNKASSEKSFSRGQEHKTPRDHRWAELDEEA